MATLSGGDITRTASAVGAGPPQVRANKCTKTATAVHCASFLGLRVSDHTLSGSSLGGGTGTIGNS